MNLLDAPILAVIIAVTVLISLRAFKDNGLLNKFLLVPYRVVHNNESYRVLSHMVIHGDTAHLLFNMFSLFILGQHLALSLMANYGVVGGQVHFFLLYLLGGIFATFIPIFRRKEDPYYSSLGASGAVSAVIFACIIWDPTMQLGLLILPGLYIPAYIFGPLYLLAEYIMDKRGGTGIAHDAHIGGALFGILYVLIINIDKGKEFLNIFI